MCLLSVGEVLVNAYHLFVFDHSFNLVNLLIFNLNLCKFSCLELIRYTRLHDKLDVTGLIFSFSSNK